MSTAKLHNVCINRDIKKIETILSTCTDIDINSPIQMVDTNYPILFYVCTMPKIQLQLKLVELTLSYPGINVNYTDGGGRTILMLLLFISHNMQIIELLLAHPDIDVNKRDNYGNFPLRYAMVSTHSMFELFVNHPKIDINQCNLMGRTALHILAMSGCTRSANVLLKHPDINVNVKDIHGESPLYYAVNGYVLADLRFIKLLLSHPNIDVDSE